MTHADWQCNDLYALFDDLCDGSISESDATRLDELLCNDAAARWEYLCYLDVHAGLGLIGAKGNNSSGVLGGRGLGTSVPRVVGSGQRAVGSNQRLDSASHPSPFIICPSPTIHDPLSAIHPFIGGVVFSYLAAALILGMAMLIAGLWKLPDYQQLARQSVPLLSPLSPLPSMVGRVTGMVDCKWKGSDVENSQSPIPNLQSLVSLGDRFALSSGLMEITYDTGAKVILQGPVTYEVESKDGGYLSIGKLTARVEKKAAESKPQSLIPNPSLSTKHYSLFTIKTPTATVTDLGTEFGVLVDSRGKSEVHVLAGAVELRRATDSPIASGLRMDAGQARSIDNGQTQSWKTIPVDRAGFTNLREVIASRSTGAGYAVLFRDDFDAFSLGARWAAIAEGKPNLALHAAADGKRSVLRMRSQGDYGAYKGIQTVDSIPIDGLADLQIEVCFQPREGENPPLEIRVVGASRGFRMYLQPHTPRRIGAGPFSRGQIVDDKHNKYSDNGVYETGQWCCAVMHFDDRGALVVLKDDLNLAWLCRLRFDAFRLRDLGEQITLQLRQVGYPGIADESLVDSVTVRGRLAGGKWSAEKPQTT